MKTLDEVIAELEDEGLFADALHYLKEYKAHQADWNYALANSEQFAEARDKHIEALKELKQKKKEYDDILTDYVALKTCWVEQQANLPMTWDELKQMKGKPVWVEWTKTEESYWCFVGEWFDDDEMRIYHIGRDYADYIHKTVYTPDIVQAYRKERK